MTGKPPIQVKHMLDGRRLLVQGWQDIEVKPEAVADLIAKLQIAEPGLYVVNDSVYVDLFAPEHN